MFVGIPAPTPIRFCYRTSESTDTEYDSDRYLVQYRAICSTRNSLTALCQLINVQPLVCATLALSLVTDVWNARVGGEQLRRRGDSWSHTANAQACTERLNNTVNGFRYGYCGGRLRG